MPVLEGKRVIIDIFDNILLKWKVNILSIKGHSNLLKMFCGNLGIYFILIFEDAKKVFRFLESLKAFYYVESLFGFD